MSSVNGIMLGTNKKDSTLCIVEKCTRVALYRSLKTSKRGYCSMHKSLAVEMTLKHKRQIEAHNIAKEYEA
jgi:hypothetical protein